MKETYSSTRQAQRRWTATGKALLVLGILVLSLPLLSIALFIPMGAHQLWERASGKTLLLDEAVSVDSPDRRLRFHASREGELKILDIKTGKVKHPIVSLSPTEYGALEVKWKDTKNVVVFALLRYPALSRGSYFRWDLISGKLIEEYADGSPVAPNPSP